MIHLLPSLLFILLATASAQMLATSRLTCEVAEAAGTTILTTKTKAGDEPVVFQIRWKNTSENAIGFKSSIAADGEIISTYRLGKTTFTRTILASTDTDCIFIHIVADQPGEVSLSARFVSERPADIFDRRGIFLLGEHTNACAWILPFESDVHDDSYGTIHLNGEGEALILLTITANPESTPIFDTLQRLGRKYDPAHDSPDPHRIWKGVIGGDREMKKK